MNLFSVKGAKLLSVRRNADSLIFSALGFYFIYLLTRHSGIGLSPDSVIYLSVARNFSHGNGLNQFDHVAIVDFPVFYPIVLGTLSFILRLDALVYSPMVNGLMFAMVIYVAGSIMNELRTFSRWYKLIMLSIIVLSPALLEIYPMLWSETLFILLLLIFFITARNYFQRRENAALIWMAITAGLACVTRYAGVTIIGTGCILLFFDSGFQFRKRIRPLLFFGIISCTPLILNLIRNRILYGYSTGQRQRGTTSFIDNCYFFGSVLCDWLPLPKERHALSIAIAFFCVALITLLFISAIRKSRSSFSFEEITITFTLVYIFFILLSATISRYQQLNSRLLAPMFISICWAFSYRLPGIARSLDGKKKWIAWIIFGSFSLAFQYNQLAADYETYDGVKDAGVPGYTEDPFPQTEIVKYIINNSSKFQKGYTIYSNAADAFYLFTSLPADVLPQIAFPRHVEQFYKEKHFYLIWFNEIVDPDQPMLKDILDHRKMIPVAELPDGSVWESVD
jgi:hypothetical protein